MSNLSRVPYRCAVQLYYYPFASYHEEYEQPGLEEIDLMVDSNGERWIALPEGPCLFYGPLPEHYAKEAEVAHVEAYDLSGGAPS